MIEKDYQSLTELLEWSCERYAGQRIYGSVLRNKTEWMTFDELLQGARRWAAALAKAGIKPRELVALQGPSNGNWAAAFFGIQLAGATAVPVDDQLPDADRQKILDKAQPSAFIAAKKLVEGLREWAEENEDALFELTPPGELPNDDPPPSPEFQPDDLACILFTSGTTGGHKGVCLTHRNLTSNVKGIAQLGLFKEGDRMLSVLPLHHSYAFTVYMLTPLHLGIQAALLPAERASQIAHTLETFRPEILTGVPKLYSLMAKGIMQQVQKQGRSRFYLYQILTRVSLALRPMFGPAVGRRFFRRLHDRLGGSLNILVSAGAKLDPAVGRMFTAFGFEVCEGYGLTECSPAAAFSRPGQNRVGSVGQPLDGVEIRIDNPKDGIGEVCIKGPNVFPGYYKDPEATKTVLVNGELRTGDLGYFDRKGRLVLCGRIKEVIVLPSGKKIFPNEIECIVDENPHVAESAVLDQNGSMILLVVPANVAADVPPDEIKAGIQKGLTKLFRDLPSYSRPRNIHLVDGPLPRTNLGKLRRHLLEPLIPSRRV